jgi:hypothetical protein
MLDAGERVMSSARHLVTGTDRIDRDRARSRL